MSEVLYYFPKKFINKFRVLLYSIGLTIVAFKRLLFGSTVFFLLFIVKDFMYALIVRNQSFTHLEASYLSNSASISIFLYAFMYFCWKIKKIANNETSSRFEFVILIIKKFLQIQFVAILFALVYLFTIQFYLIPLVYFYPAIIFFLPLYLLQENFMFQALYNSIKLCIGNWLYISFSFGILLSFVCLVNIFVDTFHVNTAKHLIIKQIICFYLFLPYFSAYTLMILNSLQQDKLNTSFMNQTD